MKGRDSMAKVLIIDDSWLTRKTVFGYLKSNNHECVEATNGAEGITLLDKIKPDCIILDLLMPDMNGLEVI